ncbi:MAG: hypothetical protein AW12_00818 [Candidatus Accumulibacter sp. BA-94]|uniref:hypothetical protein n=1 Tax=Accumulibacter sp. TaxID=2053492 RepID=UPI000450CAC2|nr:hypothetical protein [Accumulibacter sp.]EXI92075.1 MAG: hypothetical protein AW12_00818 [Candidatus Accumulibacter sp. BA-94]HRD86766.1 hypothetical protein [Accumulibacter sp.]
MPILDGDIKLLKSAVLDDVPEGGGMATGIAVVDGVSNNLFPDISELDRTYGRIALRKVFPAVLTDTVDGYYGSHVIIAQAPADPRVSASLFTTRSWSDVRTAAQNKLESYLALGSETRLTLYGNHLVGQKSVQVHCAHATASPGVGEVLGLVQRDTPTNYQYVRITRIISRAENQVFTDQYGDYVRDVLVIEISDALRLAFTGAPVTRYTSDYYNPPTRVHATFAADATSYYGVSPLALAASLGDLALKAATVYTQIVPSALSEAPIIDARCTGDRELIVPIAGAPALSFVSTVTTTPGQVAVRYFGRAIARGSLQLSIGGVTLVDDGTGALVAQSGFTGSVDYASGAVSVARSTGTSGSATYTAAQAAAIAVAGHTESTPISLGNRGYNYVINLSPAPAPGSVSVDYMALGKWYRLIDNGTGNLSGDDGVGTGMVDYGTGSMVVTLGALPDVNTEILYSWGTPAHYAPQVGGNVFSAPAVKISVAGGALQPSNLTITYLANAITKTVTDNGAGGLTGDGTGWVDYANGKVVMLPSVLPDSNSTIQTQFKQGTAIVENHAAGGASSNFSLSNAVLPKSLTLTFSDNAGGRYTVRDDGAGALVLIAADLTLTGSGSQSTAGNQASVALSIASTAGIGGSINYGTGAVALGGQVTLQAVSQSRTMTGATYEDAVQTRAWSSASSTAVATGNIVARYRQAANSAGGLQSQSQTIDPLQIDLLPSISNTLVPGSLRFTLNGSVYVDRAGSLVRDPSASTNSGTVAGSINYASGVVSLSDYTGGGATALSVACLTRKGLWEDWRYRFRVSGAPVQPASFAVRANRASDSVQISASSALDGTISSSEIAGTIDAQFGIVTLHFGSLVADSGLSPSEKLEWWYSAGRVSGGMIFRPKLVMPDTALFNAVAVSNLPLSAEVLGLDPVRLPVDGRVPVLRKGDVLVIHHTATTSPTTVSNGQTINLGRVRIARLRVIGANDQTIAAGYTTDLDAGTITFTDVSGYSQPVRVEHRIEDMALCSDAQINGDLVITKPLTHDFPLGSLVSSALIMGDLHARVSHWFDQATWTGVWSDTLIGSGASPSYNTTQYPIVVTNRGAIQERWQIIFTNTTTVNVIGETIGQIVTGHAIANPLAPINPATGVPYFSIDPAGWGAGWAAGNLVRLNTVAGNYPVWVARTVLQGPPAAANDQFTIGIRGDVDTP